VAARLKALGATADVNSPAEFQKFISDDRAKWVKLAKEANIVQQK